MTSIALHVSRDTLHDSYAPRNDETYKIASLDFLGFESIDNVKGYPCC